MGMKKFIILIVAIAFTAITAEAKVSKTLYMVGDATMAEYPLDSSTISACGWGQMLQQYLAPKVEVVNAAQIGMSAKVLLETGGIENIEKLRARSMVFLQFGTNDLKELEISKHSTLEALTHRLNDIIKLARQNRVNIILCTPLAQPYYQDSVLIDRLGGYADNIRHVAAYNHIALLDLEQVTRVWLEGMTEEEAAQYYVTLNKNELVEGEYQLNQAGAQEVARMAKEAMRNVNSKRLKKLLKK